MSDHLFFVIYRFLRRHDGGMNDRRILLSAELFIDLVESFHLLFAVLRQREINKRSVRKIDQDTGVKGAVVPS